MADASAFHCDGCVFFSLRPERSRVSPQGQLAGQCRRHAPSVLGDGQGSVRTFWPIVFADQFCGDHTTMIEEPAE